MKRVLILSITSLLSVVAMGQQQYLLQPADSSGSVEVNESALLKKIGAQKTKINRIQKGIEGYRIEIYQGSDRKAAQEILSDFKENHPNVPAELVFENPYVKVKVGAFRNKLEAQKLYKELNEELEGVKIVFVKGMPYPPLNCDEGKLEEEGY